MCQSMLSATWMCGWNALSHSWGNIWMLLLCPYSPFEPFFACIVSDRSTWSNDGWAFGSGAWRSWLIWLTYEAFDVAKFTLSLSFKRASGWIIKHNSLYKSLLISGSLSSMSSGVGGKNGHLENDFIPVVRLTCIACFSPISQSILNRFWWNFARTINFL